MKQKQHKHSNGRRQPRASRKLNATLNLLRLLRVVGGATICLLLVSVAQAADSNVYIYRKGLMSWNQTYDLVLDGRPLARFAPGSCVARYIEPGAHVLMISGGNLPIKVLRIDAGRSYFIKADFWGLKWDEVSEQKGHADISKLKREPRSGGLTLEQAIAHGLDPSTIQELDPPRTHNRGKVTVTAVAKSQ